jgi:NADH-quinone oxidoreductase subunit E
MSFHPKMAYDATFHKSSRRLEEEGPPFAYTPENRARFDEIVNRYPPDRRRSAVLPALYLAQYQQGYVTANAIRHVAGLLGITPAEVEDVVSFYTMFYTKPVGKFVLQVCRTLSCALNGAERVTEELTTKLGIRPGETDPGGTFTLLEVECLGACDRAPVVMVNDAWHECLRPQDATKLVEDLRARGEGALSGCHHVIEGRKADRQEGRKAEGQEGRKAEGQEGRKAEGQEGRKAEGQESRKKPWRFSPNMFVNRTLSRSTSTSSTTGTRGCAKRSRSSPTR